MFQFVTAVIFVVAALCVLFYAVFIADGSSTGGKAAPATAAAALVVLAFGLFAWSGVKSVPVKNIGIPVSFGAVGSSVLLPGAHETWNPFEHVIDINETVQTTTWEDKGNDPGSSCRGGLRVRIGGQQNACADITIQWQIRDGAAAGLFSSYANTGDFMAEVQNAIVVRELEQVVNNVVGDYNPITDTASITGANSAPSQFTGFGPTILRDMRADIGSRVNVLSVLFTQLNYNTALENKLAGIQQAYADYATAQENVRVATEEKLALQQLGTPTEEQLIAQCLKQAGGNNPGSCIPGATTKLQLSGSASTSG